MKNPLNRRILSVIALLLLNLSVVARMSGDVKTTLLDVETEYGAYHFEIHFPKSEENYLNRVIEVLKNDTAKLADYFKYSPKGPVHFVLLEDAQRSNGSATVFPANYINLRKYPPLGMNHLSSSSDYVKELILHELIHIIHMDQTRGIAQGVRNVFGSFGKLGGVTPRWFTEGIATWGESALTNGGRLKNELLRSEWESAIESERFCKTIDCLDEPGKFPYGQYAYWTGAFFMDYLEQLKANSVQCLIFANSNNIPFFLNSAFEECFGKNAISLYKEFREDTLAKIKAREEEKAPALTPIPNVLGHKSFQQGMVIIKDKLLSVEVENRIQKIVQQDLIKGESKKIPFVGKLASIEKLSESTISIKTFSNIRSSTFRDSAIYDLEKVSKNKRSGDYNFTFESEDLSLTFNQKNWVINDGEYSFPEEISITSLRSTNNGIFFRLFDSRRMKIFAYFYDVKNKKMKEGFEVKESFIILDSCSDGIIAKENGNLHYITESSRSIIDTPISSRIVAGSFGKDYSVVVLKDSKSVLYKWNVGCRDLEDKLKNIKKVSFKEIDLKKFKSLTLEQKQVSYPRAKHFLPTHWMLNYTQATDSLSFWSALTTISDPDQRHTLSLKGIFYTDISEVTPEIDYLYEFPNDFYLSLGHSKKYTESSQRIKYDSSEVSAASVSKLIEIGNFNFVTGLYASHIEVDDFISKRKEKEFGAILRLDLVQARLDDFVSESSVKVRVFKREVEHSPDYNGVQSILKTELHPLRDFYLGADLSYSSLDKSDYSSGVIYGGGNYTEFHQFFGISYNDIFGNEVKAMRAHLKYELLSIYRGAGFIPIFIKEVHLLAGTDVIAADRILIDNTRYLRNSSAQSYWAGARSEFTIGYAIPMSLDIIRSRVMNRYGQDIDSTSTVLSGSFGF